jgi:hypothetical protein
MARNVGGAQNAEPQWAVFDRCHGGALRLLSAIYSALPACAIIAWSGATPPLMPKVARMPGDAR